MAEKHNERPVPICDMVMLASWVLCRSYKDHDPRSQEEALYCVLMDVQSACVSLADVALRWVRKEYVTALMAQHVVDVW